MWALATYILTTGIKGVSSMKIHRDLNITHKIGVASRSPHLRGVD